MSVSSSVKSCSEYNRREIPYTQQAQSVCRAVTDATRILYDPLDWGICSLTAKRTGESPVGRMMSNLGSDMLRQAYALFGVEFSKCTNFPERRVPSAKLTLHFTKLCTYLKNVRKKYLLVLRLPLRHF
jgi:hypothetical protein